MSFATAPKLATEKHAPAMPGAVHLFGAGASGNAMSNVILEWSVFGSHAADRILREKGDWKALLSRIALSGPWPDKASCPWIKMAIFGDIRSRHGSLRHDANVIAICGVECDYDGEKITPEQGIAALEGAQIRAAVYTSPSHTADKPRWRVIAPLSQHMPPSSRAALVARINGVLHGVLAQESFTLSQSYFFGAVQNAAPYQVLLTFDDADEGLCIDELDGLDDIAIGKKTVSDAAAAVTAHQPHATMGATRYITPDQVLELQDALGFVDPDDYHQWIDVGQALRGIEPSTVGFGLWDKWSRRSDKYDASEMGKRWRGFAPRTLNLETVFYRAQQGGWVNPLGKLAAAREAQLQALADKAQTHADLVPVAAPERVDVVRPFPVARLDELCAWICRTQGIRPSVPVQMAALAVASLAASRLYVSEYGDSAHLYQLLCTHSVVESLPLHKAVGQVVRDAGLRKMLREQRFTAPATLYKTLMRSPATLWMAHEWGTMAAFARRQSSGQLDHVMNLMVNAYLQDDICLDNVEELSMKGASGVDDDMPVIRRPALSMFALTSQAMLPSSFTVSEIGRGGIEQMLFHSGTVAYAGEAQPEPAPLWMINHLRAMRRLPPVDATQDASAHVPDLDLASIFNGNAQLLPTQQTVRFDAKPQEHYSRFDTMCSGTRDAKPLANGARTALRRLAVLLAAWGNPHAPVVSRDILDWCAAFVADRLSESLAALHFSGGSEDGKSSAYQAVLHAIAQQGAEGTTQTDIVRSIYKFRALTGAKRDELIAQLLEDGEVVEQRNTNNKGNRLYAASAMAAINVATKHVQNTQNTSQNTCKTRYESTTYVAKHAKH